jgi:hypothetical protein
MARLVLVVNRIASPALSALGDLYAFPTGSALIQIRYPISMHPAKSARSGGNFDQAVKAVWNNISLKRFRRKCVIYRIVCGNKKAV